MSKRSTLLQGLASILLPLALIPTVLWRALPVLHQANQLRHVSEVDTTQRRPAATLQFITGSALPTVGATTPITILLDSGGTPIGGGDIVITYPPDKLHILNVDFTDSPCIALHRYSVVKPGNLTINCLTQTDQAHTNQLSNLATLHIQSILPGPIEISFDKANTVILSTGNLANVLHHANGLTLTAQSSHVQTN